MNSKRQSEVCIEMTPTFSIRNGFVSRLLLYASMLVLGTSKVPMTFCSAQESPQYHITTRRSDDRVAVISNEDQVAFKIQSPFGISQATIQRTGDRWPERVILQLQLKGLESIRMVADPVELRGALSSQDGEFRLWRGTEENALLDSESPFWVALRLLDRDGNPTKKAEGSKGQPASDGWIELRLPKAVFETNPTNLTVHWVDFYR
jgi:hypothetical protein